MKAEIKKNNLDRNIRILPSFQDERIESSDERESTKPR